MPLMSPADAMIGVFVLAITAATVTLCILAVIERAFGDAHQEPTDMATRED